MFRERGFEADHSTINRWVLADVPMIEKQFASFVDRSVDQSVSTNPTSKSAANGDTYTEPSTNTEIPSISC